MDKIIVFTGSFNPVTKAHVESLRIAMQTIGASKGIFVPVCDGYLKKKMLKNMERLALSAKSRIDMLKIVCDKSEGLEVSDYEVKNGDSTHTYRTLEYFKEKYSDCEIHFLNGADKLKNIPNWNNAEELLKNIRFVLFNRADMDASDLIRSHPLLSRYASHFTILPATEDFADVSSSKVRKLFLAGNDEYKNMMDDDVAEYFSRTDLSQYPAPTVYDWIDMKLKGGPFDKQSGYKKVYDLNKTLFSSLDLSAQLEGSGKLTLLSAQVACCGNAEVVFTDEDHDLLIAKLKAKGLDPAIICETCFSRAGGGYDQGKADTAEEELCRVSTLSQSLYKYGNPKLKCVKQSGVNAENAYPLEVGEGFFSPDVLFVRHGASRAYRETPVPDRQKCDIISIASLDFTKTHLQNHTQSYMNDDGRMNASGIQLMTDALRKAFNYAIASGHDAVIINAFGSGFHVSLKDSAQILNVVIKEYSDKLKCIVIREKRMKRFQKIYFEDQIAD